MGNLMTSPSKRLHASHIQFADPDNEGCWFFEAFPCPVVLDTGTHVWVTAALMDRLPPGTLAVGTGMDSGFDHMGNRIVAIPERFAVN